jgi:hypothetical protein
METEVGRGTPHPAPPTGRDSSRWAGTQTGTDRNKTGLIIRRSLWSLREAVVLDP